MPTYYEIMTTDLSKLIAAAESWDETAKKLHEQGKAYRRDVYGIILRPTARGVTAAAASRQFGVTLKEFQNAQVEAKAIASLFRDAHAQFVDLRKKLETVRDEAIEKGMRVSDQGVVSYDTGKLSTSELNALRHDPDYQESVRKVVAPWQQRIDQLVKDVGDADKGAEIAFNAVVIDSDTMDGTVNGFNGRAQGDIEKYEAQEAEDIAKRITNGEKVSAADLAKLQRAFRDNADDEAFSQTLLNSLGADGTLKLANKINDLAYLDDTKRKADYLNIERGLAQTLSTATQDPSTNFYKDFRTELQKAGVQKYDFDVAGEKMRGRTGYGQQVRGYQSLVTLMQHGHGYSEQFLRDMAEDIRKAEDKNQGGKPNIWTLRGYFSGKEDGWFANDPLDGVLGIMSENPKAAASYLDPGPNGKNDNLKYLLTERDWNHVATSQWFGNIERDGEDTFDEDVRTGLGLAIEAAATGNHPNSFRTDFGRHSEVQARIMHDTINLLDYGAADGKTGETDRSNPRVGKADELLGKKEYTALRAPVSRALADYAPDIVDIINGDAPGGRAGKESAFMQGDQSHIQNSRASLLRIMRGVSEADDPSNFERLYHAQHGYLSQELMDRDFPNKVSISNQARKVGETFGVLDAIGGDVKMDTHKLKSEKSAEARFYGYHILGGMITGIPVVGDGAQRLVDIGLNEWLSAVQAEESALSREEISRDSDVTQDRLDAYFDRWGKERKFDSHLMKEVSGEAQQSYADGRQIARDALRGG